MQRTQIKNRYFVEIQTAPDGRKYAVVRKEGAKIVGKQKALLEERGFTWDTPRMYSQLITAENRAVTAAFCAGLYLNATCSEEAFELYRKGF